MPRYFSSEYQPERPVYPVRPTIIPIGPSIAYIKLTRGQFALIDRENAPWLGQWNWQARYIDSSKLGYYAVRTSRESGKPVRVAMHSLIVAPPKGKLPDHRNGNGLNNMRFNLRAITSEDNHINRRLNVTSKTKLKGVDYVQRFGKFRARITVANKTLHLGWFDLETAAGAAYQEASVLYHGEYARQ